MRAVWMIMHLWLPASVALCQDIREQTIDVEELSEMIISPQDEDLNYEALYENLVQTISAPLDLNTVTAEELASLNILTDDQIENLLAWRVEQGAFLDVYELQVLPGYDRDTIMKLLPFVKVKDMSTRLDKSLFRKIFSAGNSYLVTRFERALGSNDSSDSSSTNSDLYVGTADKIYIRMRSSVPGDFSVGFTGEKDAGERILLDRDLGQWGFDFTSFHFQIRNRGALQNLVVGDFQTQFAQGLMLGGAFGIGKGGENITTVRKSSLGFQPYTSVHEGAYQRGVAMTLNLSRHLGISIFYSNARRDASAREGEDSLQVHSLLTTGLHRTEKELLTRKKIREQNTGFVIQFKKQKFDAGLIANYIHFDSDLRKKPALYNQFSFAGNTNFNTGIFLNYRVSNMSFFSETAKSLRGGLGTLLGLLISVHKNLDFAVLYRYYSRDLHTFYSNTFSENTTPQNERGFFWAWKYRWDRRYSMNGYVDLFTFPWLSFRRYSPSTGYEWLLRGNYKPSRAISVFMQIREECKSLNLPETTNLYKVGERVRRNAAFNLEYGITRNMRLKSRIQYNAQDFNGTLTEGWALALDISLRLGKLEFSGRHGLFDTDHYDNRHYVYESDAWSSYSLPAYEGTGVRNYALVEYRISKWLTLWLRYARTRMLSIGEIDARQDAIDGNTQNDVKFQTRLTF